jgi:hypothetical protein
MAKYRKKPVVIEALLYAGSDETALAIVEWSDGKVSAANGDHTLAIETLEGTMCAEPGDYIIRGVKGEYYPCKPDIFSETYEPVGAEIADVPLGVPSALADNEPRS